MRNSPVAMRSRGMIMTEPAEECTAHRFLVSGNLEVGIEYEIANSPDAV
jgi:hypothetical protein